MKLPVYTPDGSEAGRQVELDDAVFGIEPNDTTPSGWMSARSRRTCARAPTRRKSAPRSLSRGGSCTGRRGTGNARAGDAKSPLRKGGGTIFGPRPPRVQAPGQPQDQAARAAQRDRAQAERRLGPRGRSAPARRPQDPRGRGDAQGQRRRQAPRARSDERQRRHLLPLGPQHPGHRGPRRRPGVNARPARRRTRSFSRRVPSTRALTSALRPAKKSASSTSASAVASSTDDDAVQPDTDEG